MKINYITGPAGCGKTHYLSGLEKQASSKGLSIVRIDPACTGTMIQAALSASKEGCVILIDEGLRSYRLSLIYEAYTWPVGSQVFVAGEGERNVWEEVK